MTDHPVDVRPASAVTPASDERVERHPFVLDCERNYECAFCGFGATHRAHKKPYEIPNAAEQVPRCDDPEHKHNEIAEPRRP